MFLRRKNRSSITPEYMIVGLGNPGSEYAGTRHNIGFEVIDHLVSKYHIKLNQRKHRALYGIGEIQGLGVLLVKPMTYMNLSGQAIAPLAKEYRISPEKIIIVADDLDLNPGRVRIKARGGAGGHNGHKSIIQSLRTEEYPRIRIGIGKSDSDTIDYVLSGFTSDERHLIGRAVELSMEGCELILTEGIEKAMADINSQSS